MVVAAQAVTPYSAVAGTMVIEYDALGGKENGGDSFHTAGRVLLDRLVTDKGGTLQSMTLFVKLQKADLGNFRVVGAREAAGTNLPGRLEVLATVADANITPGRFFGLTITPASPITIKPNTPYYVGIASAAGGKSSIVLGNTLSTSVIARPNVLAGGYYYNNGGLQPNSGGPYQIKVIVTKR